MASTKRSCPECATREVRARILTEIGSERDRQDELWGEQNHADGTGPFALIAGEFWARDAARNAKAQCDAASGAALTWQHILVEEVFEALAESDPIELRSELIQVAAVAAQWVECIDRRKETAHAHTEA